MKWYNIIHEGVSEMLSGVEDWEDVFLYLVVLPIVCPFVVFGCMGVGVGGLVKLTFDSKTSECLGISSRNALMGLVLLFYACMGVIVITGTYMAVVSLFERFVK